MEVTESGIVNEVRLEHPQKARPPIEVTELGIVNEGSLEQRPNAP